MKESNITNYKHVICSQHILWHITAKLAKDEMVSSEKERRMKERRFIRNWRRTIGMLVMLVPRKYVRSTWIWSRKTIPPFTSISWIGETVNSSTLMTNLTSVKIRTILVNESLNGRMRLKTDLDDPIRDSNCYNIIYRFITLALTLSTRRLECLDLRPDPISQSGEASPPNPTWCQSICKTLPRVGHHAVVKGSSVYEIYHIERRKERVVTMERNALQFMLCMTIDGKRNSR